MENKFKVQIKARVQVPFGNMGNPAERFNGKDVTIIDFESTVAGLLAVALVEENEKTIFHLFSLNELYIPNDNEKNK